MENAFLYLLTALVTASIVLCVVILLKLNNVAYLLEQPVVKKMSPQLRLKPVRLDDGEGDANRRNSRPASAGGRGRGQDKNEGQDRNREAGPARDSGHRDRPARPERERAEGGERPARPDRDRNRDRDRDRSSRGDHRNRPNRQEVHSNGRDGSSNGREAVAGASESGRENGRDAMRESARDAGPSAPRRFEQPALVENNHNDNVPPVGLAPRRRLPTAGRDEEQSLADLKPAAETSHDHLFVGADDGEIQHGRRNQLKKKPRFDLDEAEATESPRAETNA